MQGTALDRVQAALRDHGQRQGPSGNWTCPAHEDRNPSLAVAKGRKGVLLTCHAGCTNDAILQALGLTAAELFDDYGERAAGGNGNGTGDRTIVATYDYTDEAGRLLFQVVRFHPKDFRQRRPDPASRDGWTYRLGDTPRVLFHLPALAIARELGTPVFVAEGEKDVLALERAGAIATCNPGGADSGSGGKWKREHTDALRGLDVVIVRDMDDAGHRHAQYVAAQLDGVAKSVRIVEPATGKDAADHLNAGLGLDAFREADAPDPLGDVPESWRPVDTDALQAHPPQPPELVRATEGDGALLYRNRVQLLSGPPESGKSWIALLAAAETLAGGETVVWIDTDGQGWSDTLERLTALGVTAEQRAGFHYLNPDEPVTKDAVHKLSAHLQPALVVIDSWNPALALQGCSSTSTDDVERWNQTVLRPWGTDVTILLVDHVTKDPEKRGSYSYGSERKLGLVQVHIGLDVTGSRLSRETAGTFHLRALKDRPGWHKRAAGTAYIGEIVLRPDGDTIQHELRLGSKRDHEDDGDGPGFVPTGLMERISAYTAAEPGREIPSSEIVQAVKGRREWVLKGLQALTTHGYLQVQQSGAARMYRHVARYHDGDDLTPFPTGPG